MTSSARACGAAVQARGRASVALAAHAVAHAVLALFTGYPVSTARLIAGVALLASVAWSSVWIAARDA